MATKPKGPNVALLRRLARKLRRLRHEEHYDQSTYGTHGDCGTAACIAGHAVSLLGGKFSLRHWNWMLEGKPANARSIAQRAIRLEDPDRVFSACPEVRWPSPFSDRWNRRWQTGERPSRIAADYLDHLADEAERKGRS